MSDHVQSIKVFYTNLASNKAHLYWKQSVGIALTFWAQAVTIPLERVHPQMAGKGKCHNTKFKTLRGIPAHGRDKTCKNSKIILQRKAKV